MGERVHKVIHAVESLLSKSVWKDTFLLRWAHGRIDEKLTGLKESEKNNQATDQSKVERVSVFVEIYQKDLGIITLSRVISSIGDRAFGKNVYRSHADGKKSAEMSQRTQKNIAFIEIKVMPDKVIGSDADIKLAQRAISINNVIGAWFRDVYYNFDVNKRMFIRA